MSGFDRNWRPNRSPEAAIHFAGRVEELRTAVRLLEPETVAARSGASYLELAPGRGELHVPVWQEVYKLTWPQLSTYSDQDEPVPDSKQALLLYYLLNADGTGLRYTWLSFAELPDGRMYNAAFQGYSGDEVARRYGLDLDAFRCACQKAGGQEQFLANASFVFPALPRVPLMLTYWLGDEDFPSSCKVLFDASVSHYLPTDVCAILGSMLVQRVIRS